jgi:integrase
MRITKPHLTKINAKTGVFWQVVLPKPGGGRSRKAFQTQTEAKAYLNEATTALRYGGTSAFTISDLLREQAMEADRILKPLGVSVLDAARDYITRHAATLKSVPVSEAVDGLLSDLRANGRSPAHQNNTRLRLSKFAAEFGQQLVCDVDTASISSWLQGLGTSAVDRNNTRATLSMLFNFAVARGWSSVSPVGNVAKAKVIQSPVGILTPEQLTAILEAADDRTRPYWAIAAFTGLRDAEMKRLDWRNVGAEYVEVTARNAKSARRRLVKMADNLIAWLEPYRSREGRVAPPNLRKLMDADCFRARIADWPPNALRHSFASYALALRQDAARVALDLGHTDASLVFAHYRELVSKDAAERWFTIRPFKPLF